MAVREGAPARFTLEFAMKHVEQAAAETPEVSFRNDEFTRTTVARLIKMRAMLQETRNRSAELQNALELFKYKQAKIHDG